MEGDNISSSASVELASAAAVAEKNEQKREQDEEEEGDLELGLSLGASNKPSAGCAAVVQQPWGEYCRILTAEDFPSIGNSRAYPRSPPSASSVTTSKPAAGGSRGGAVAGAKRAAADAVGPPSPPARISQVVGWPPIRAFRMNNIVNQSKENTPANQKTSNFSIDSIHPTESNYQEKKDKGVTVSTSPFVKVNMDGDPIGRKVDLNSHSSYESLATALETMFYRPTTSFGSSFSKFNGPPASKLLDGTSEFALTYEDKDGDWMLVGDVPWRMFRCAVRRLRIMRTSDLSGLAPRTQSSRTRESIQS